MGFRRLLGIGDARHEAIRPVLVRTLGSVDKSRPYLVHSTEYRKQYIVFKIESFDPGSLFVIGVIC